MWPRGVSDHCTPDNHWVSTRGWVWGCSAHRKVKLRIQEYQPKRGITLICVRLGKPPHNKVANSSCLRAQTGSEEQHGGRNAESPRPAVTAYLLHLSFEIDTSGKPERRDDLDLEEVIAACERAVWACTGHRNRTSVCFDWGSFMVPNLRPVLLLLGQAR